MCGIVGIRRFDGQPVDAAVLQCMTDLLVHRGPDEAGQWTQGPVGFGHRRLSIVDVDGSHQPMASPGGRLHVTFNGEIFNYRELRRGDHAYPFTTSGDTEVLLAMFARFGADSVTRLRGQFAYAVHDAATDDLWLFRDRLGVLPLFYYRDEHLFAFASEIKALLPALPHRPEIDLASLDGYLASRSVPAPFTLFEGVRKLLPGHVLRVASNGTIDVDRYWTLPTCRARTISDADAVREVADAVRDAVRCSLVADVPVGALLSGGLDSSLIVALATELRDGEPISTYSAGFGDPRYDELPYAREASALLGTRHHEVTVRPSAFADRWQKLTWHRDAPISEPADIAVFELAAAARPSVRVLLSGEGSDELFAGYPKYKVARWAAFLDTLPRGLQRSALALADRATPAGATRAHIALRALLAPSEKAQLVSWFSPFTSAQRQGLLDGRPRHVIDTALDGSDRLERMLAFDFQSWLPDNLLERGDRMAMSASVELRPPLLDHRLVELAFSLPSKFKIRRGQGKWVLRQVARSHLPSSIIDRHKVGFRVPLDAWFRSDLREMARDMLLGPGSFVGDVMDPGEIRRIVERHEQGPSDESIRIWTLLSLEHWHQVFFRSPSSTWALDPRAALETPTV